MIPRGEVRIRGLRELHAGDECFGDSHFFGEGDDRSLDGEVFEPVTGTTLEDEVA